MNQTRDDGAAAARAALGKTAEERRVAEIVGHAVAEYRRGIARELPAEAAEQAASKFAEVLDQTDYEAGAAAARVVLGKARA